MARIVFSATGLPSAPQEGHVCAGSSKEALRDVREGPEADRDDRSDPEQRPAEPAGVRVLAATIVALCGLGLAVGEPETGAEQAKGGGGEDGSICLESGEEARAADPDRREDERADASTLDTTAPATVREESLRARVLLAGKELIRSMPVR
jgi:hypothetical protein